MVRVKVQGRYSTYKIKTMAEFKCWLPNFYQSRIMDVKAYVYGDTIGDHNLFLGYHFCSGLVLILDYKNKVIIWDNLVIPTMNKSKSMAVTAILNEHEDLDLPLYEKDNTLIIQGT